ncbi:10697_t:CDS:1, partial [Dentiscutata heterogama]
MGKTAKLDTAKHILFLKLKASSKAPQFETEKAAVQPSGCIGSLSTYLSYSSE